MSIVTSAYQTTACKDYVIKRIEDDVRAALVTGRLLNLREGIYAVPPSEVDATLATIGVFNYPLILKHGNENVVVFDARTLTGVQNGQLFQRRPDEFQSRVIFAQLAKEWVDGEGMRLLSFNPMPMGVFASWLGEVIGKRFALNAMAQMQVSIIAAVMYNNLFGDDVINERNGAETVVAISRATGFRPGDVSNVVEAHPVIDSIDQFCEVCREYTQDVHLRDLNPVTLFSVVGGYWYGNAGRESIAVALEYPPMWMTLLFQAITDRSFKKSGLTGVVERNTWRRHHENFVRAMLPRSELTVQNPFLKY